MLSLLWAVGAFSDPSYDDLFSDFETRFDRHYATNEREARKAIFISNLKYIEDFHEKNPGTVSLGVGPFADKTPEEFELYSTRGALVDEERQWGNLPYLGVDNTDATKLPKEVDWVKKGAVSPVKNQGSCGSCWTFAGTGAIEGHYQIMTGNMTELSQQQLVDCDTKGFACNGGYFWSPFDFAKKYGLCTLATYPYQCSESESANCRKSKCTFRCDVGIPPQVVTGYIRVRPRFMLSLMAALTHGPVNVGIQANSRVFQHYSKGVMQTGHCGKRLGHAVLAVGYGVDGGTKYWTIKNSWGPKWGEGGYIRIKRNYESDEGGECGILKRPSYPVLEYEGEGNESQFVI